MRIGRPPSDFEEFFFFCLEDLVEAFDVLVGHFLEYLFGAAHIVF